jgi:hypothetical protein
MNASQILLQVMPNDPDQNLGSAGVTLPSYSVAALCSFGILRMCLQNRGLDFGKYIKNHFSETVVLQINKI